MLLVGTQKHTKRNIDILKKTDNLHFSLKMLAYVKFLLYLCSVKGKTIRLCRRYLTYLDSALCSIRTTMSRCMCMLIKDNYEAKFCVKPTVELIENNGLKASELRLAESVIEENKEIIVNRWNEYFKN